MEVLIEYMLIQFTSVTLKSTLHSWKKNTCEGHNVWHRPKISILRFLSELYRQLQRTNWFLLLEIAIISSHYVTYMFIIAMKEYHKNATYSEQRRKKYFTKSHFKVPKIIVITFFLIYVMKKKLQLNDKLLRFVLGHTKLL